MFNIQVSMCYCVQYQYCKYQTIFCEMDRLFGQILPDVRAKFACWMLNFSHEATKNTKLLWTWRLCGIFMDSCLSSVS